MAKENNLAKDGYIETAQSILTKIQAKADKYDDWRDIFERIHNWGYNTDFTADPITDPSRTSVVEYLQRYYDDVYGEEQA